MIFSCVSCSVWPNAAEVLSQCLEAGWRRTNSVHSWQDRVAMGFTHTHTHPEPVNPECSCTPALRIGLQSGRSLELLPSTWEDGGNQGQKSFCRNTSCASVVFIPGLGGTFHGHPCLGHLLNGLLQCAVHEATLKEHLEASTSLELSSTYSFGCITICLCDTTLTWAAWVPIGFWV